MEQVAQQVAEVKPEVKPKATRQRKPKAVQPAEVQPQPTTTTTGAAEVQPSAGAEVTVQPVAEKAPRKKPVRAEKPVPFDFVGHAIQRYVEGGWSVHRCQPGTINDFTAHRDKKQHFVRVVPFNDVENMRFAGEQKNTFIQNATSNAATPVFANVKPVAKKGEVTPSGANVTFSDVGNNNARVIVGARK